MKTERGALTQNVVLQAEMEWHLYKDGIESGGDQGAHAAFSSNELRDPVAFIGVPERGQAAREAIGEARDDD